MPRRRHGRLFAQALYCDPDAFGLVELAKPNRSNGLMMQTRWIEILLMAGGVVSIVALFVLEAARNRRPQNLGLRRTSPALDRPDRQAAYYRAAGVLPPWRP